LNAFSCVLSADAILHISGPDSLKFLQGQTTCDTDQINEQQALNGAYCNPQGRVVCDFLLLQLGEDHYGLRMRRKIMANSKAVFGKYIIFSKAELDDSREHWQTLACWGEDAAPALAALFPKIPTQHLETVQGDGYTLVQLDQAGTRFECQIDSGRQPELAKTISNTLQKGDEQSWQALDINSGIARIEPETIEEFIPQMVNYDITAHVNFTKGCYTGQEVVARMHYRGKPKRRMYLATLAPGSNPVAGEALYSDGEQSVGNIVNSATLASGEIAALVVATADGFAAGLHVGAIDGPALTPGELPYALEKPAP
jgi:tRNA-modifying protein YgfZ